MHTIFKISVFLIPAVLYGCTTDAEDQSLLLSINSGGNEGVYNGQHYQTDKYYVGGRNYSTEAAGQSNADFNIYNTERTSKNFSYVIPVSNGNYTIKLLFAEIYFGVADGEIDGNGKRLFDVEIEGSPVVENFDIFNQAGVNQPSVKSFSTSVTDELLEINFSANRNNAKVSALEVYGKKDARLLSDNSGEWKKLTSSSRRRAEASSAKVLNRFYAFSGFERALTVTGYTESYDAINDVWKPGAPMPLPITHAGTVVVGTDVWLIGGLTGNFPGIATDRVQVYDTALDDWRFDRSLPNARGSTAAVLSGNHIHIFGGLLPDLETGVAEHYKLDLKNKSAGWVSIAPLPHPLVHLSGTALNNKIYSIAGQFGHHKTISRQKFLFAYDTVSDTWTKKADLPDYRSHFESGTFVYDGKIIVVGGKHRNSAADDIIQYDPATNLWTTLCKLPVPLVGPVARVLNGRLFVLNGGVFTVNSPTNSVWSIPMAKCLSK